MYRLNQGKVNFFFFLIFVSFDKFYTWTIIFDSFLKSNKITIFYSLYEINGLPSNNSSSYVLNQSKLVKHVKAIGKLLSKVMIETLIW